MAIESIKEFDMYDGVLKAPRAVVVHRVLGFRFTRTYVSHSPGNWTAHSSLPTRISAKLVTCLNGHLIYHLGLTAHQLECDLNAQRKVMQDRQTKLEYWYAQAQSLAKQLDNPGA